MSVQLLSSDCRSLLRVVHVQGVLAGDVRFEKTGVHVELHLLRDTVCMVDHLVLFRWQVTWVLHPRVLPGQLVTDLGHVSHLFD